jgi:hypothetical protein
MPSNQAPRVTSSSRVQALLEQLSCQRAGEYRWVRRVQWVLAMADGVPNLHLAEHYDLNRETVR